MSLSKPIKRATGLTCASIALFGIALAQDDHAPPDEGLVSVIPSLYGGDGILLFAGFFDHSAHFSGTALERLTTLSGSLAGRAAPSFNLTPTAVFEFDPITEEYIRSNELHTPSFNTEGADTIGKGRIGFGSAVSIRNYSTINGLGLDELDVDLTHIDLAGPGPDICVAGPPDNCYVFELDFVRINLDVDFREVSTVMGVTYGLTDSMDVSLFLPIVNTKIEVESLAEIMPNATAFATGVFAHSFDPDPTADQPADSAGGSHTGVGDVVLRVKKKILEGATPEFLTLATSADVRLPSGSEGNYQGIPYVGFSPKLLASADWSLGGVTAKTNANLSYNVNATAFGADALHASAGTSLEPGIRVFGRETAFTATFMGWKPLNDGEFDTHHGAAPHPTIDHALIEHDHEQADRLAEIDTGWQIDFAAGAHLPLFSRGYAFYEAQIPLNDPGVRADVIHSFGVQISF